MIRRLALLLALALVSYGGDEARAGKPKKPPPQSDGVVWTLIGSVRNVIGNYTPVMTFADGSIAVYANTDGNLDGQWYRRSGAWSQVGAATLVIPSAAVYDEGPAFYRIRTSAVQRGASGKCYAMLTVGNGYPTTDSYRPAWATSDDCANWVYRGRMLIDGSFAGYGQTDSAALIVQEDGPESPDHAQPGRNRFLVYLNYQNPTGQAGGTLGLILVYSADGVSWFRAKDAYGNWLDVWPSGLTPLGMPNVSFPTAARTPYGYHIIAGDTYPVTRLIHIWSCDGVSFRQLESASDVYGGSGKGTNLAYAPESGLLHALTAGKHWQIPAQGWAC